MKSSFKLSVSCSVRSPARDLAVTTRPSFTDPTCNVWIEGTAHSLSAALKSQLKVFKFKMILFISFKEYISQRKLLIRYLV
jgi:hypothetical protein